MGPRNAQVLQAYYDAKNLVIHNTDLFDFTKGKNTDASVPFTNPQHLLLLGTQFQEKANRRRLLYRFSKQNRKSDKENP